MNDWSTGFSTRQDVFKWVATSRLYDPRRIKEPSNAAREKTLRDRKMYQEYIEYSRDLVRSETFDNSRESLKPSKIVQEAIILAGGAVAILLQVAEPGVGKGVDNHSNFAYRPIDRLRTTMTYIYCMVYGTEEEKESIINLVHKAHAAVQGPDYSADDPKLQVKDY